MARLVRKGQSKYTLMGNSHGFWVAFSPPNSEVQRFTRTLNIGFTYIQRSAKNDATGCNGQVEVEVVTKSRK